MTGVHRLEAARPSPWLLAIQPHGSRWGLNKCGKRGNDRLEHGCVRDGGKAMGEMGGLELVLGGESLGRRMERVTLHEDVVLDIYFGWRGAFGCECTVTRSSCLH